MQLDLFAGAFLIDCLPLVSLSQGLHFRPPVAGFPGCLLEFPQSLCWYFLTVHCKGLQGGLGNSTFQSKLEVALLSSFQIDFIADLG